MSSKYLVRNKASGAREPGVYDSATEASYAIMHSPNASLLEWYQVSQGAADYASLIDAHLAAERKHMEAEFAKMLAPSQP